MKRGGWWVAGVLAPGHQLDEYTLEPIPQGHASLLQSFKSTWRDCPGFQRLLKGTSLLQRDIVTSALYCSFLCLDCTAVSSLKGQRCQDDLKNHFFVHLTLIASHFCLSGSVQPKIDACRCRQELKR